MKPVLIRLFDSDTRWGMFDPLLQTLFLSRKLLNEHHWSDVLGVLYHEMAHQWVYEKYTSKGIVSKPHDHYFREASQILGVPDQYARSGLDLSTNSVKWNQDSSSDFSEKLLDKVKKLLALSESSNEYEAANAMKRVHELYEKYNLELVQQHFKKSYVHHLIQRKTQRIPAWESRIFSILIQHFFVKVILRNIFDHHSLTHTSSFEIIGTRENVLMAEHVYYFLLNQAEYFTNLEKSKRRNLFSQREKNSFRWGLMHGFDTQLSKQKKLEESKKSSTLSQASSLRELTPINEEISKKLEIYINEIYSNSISNSKRKITVDSQSFQDGTKEGMKINLKSPINSNQTVNQLSYGQRS